MASDMAQKILKVTVTTAGSKVKARSHHDAAHLQPISNVPTKYQPPTPSYTVSKMSPDKILKVKVTKGRSNQGHTIMLHIYSP